MTLQPSCHARNDGVFLEQESPNLQRRHQSFYSLETLKLLLFLAHQHKAAGMEIKLLLLLLLLLLFFILLIIIILNIFCPMV